MDKEIHAQRTNSILQELNYNFGMMNLEDDLEEQIKIITEILSLKQAEKGGCYNCGYSVSVVSKDKRGWLCEWCSDHDLGA